MTPHGYHQQQPIVGTCLRCYQPVQGPHVAFPAGPMHPACAQAAAAPQPKKSSPAIFLLAIPVVIVVAGFVLFVVGSANKNKGSTGDGASVSASSSREPRALCTKLRDAIGEGKCTETASGYGLDVQSAVMVPQCKTEGEYRAIEPRRKEKELVFVGSERSWCFVLIMGLRGQPFPEPLITKARKAVDQF